MRLDSACAHQNTLAHPVQLCGTGLHSGASVSVAVRPAPADTGVRFRRVDLPGRPVIPARHDSVVDTSRATVIGAHGAVVATVEHLMAALSGLGIDNALVEIDASEVPVLDGSAARWCDLFREAGLRELFAPRRVLRVERAISVSEGDAFVRVTPAPRLEIAYTIDFPHPVVGRQTLRWSYDSVSFTGEIAAARTFGFAHEIETLQRMGLARGGSLENAVVLDDTGVMNEEGFRFTDECVRHKVLDLLGDLALAGFPVLGRIEARKAGHTLHARFVRELVRNATLCSPAASRKVAAPAPEVSHLRLVPRTA